MTGEKHRDLWEAVNSLRGQVASQSVLLAEIKTLVSERHTRLAGEIKEIQRERHCPVHGEKIRTMERVVWGLAAGLFGLVAKAAFELVTGP